MAEVRGRLLGTESRIGTGWPAVDAVTGGLPPARTTLVRGPSSLRLQVLARTAAWAAGEGYPTLIATRTETQDELWMAVGAGGLGLPPQALLTTTAHDAWIDARLRVLDLRAAAALRDRIPSVLIIDDYQMHEDYWDRALDPVDGTLDPQVLPRTLGCALVLGISTMDHFSELLDQTALTLRINPLEDGSRVRLSAHQLLRKDHRVVLLRDGYLEPPVPGRAMIRRAGVTNIWQERTDAEIDAFADALGADTTTMLWERDED